MQCKTCQFHDGKHCRKQPPHPVPMVQRVMDKKHRIINQPTGTFGGVWPITQPDDWCGGYQEKSRADE